MGDGVLVVVLLVLIWAAILVPSAAGAQASREADFLGSIRPGHDPREGNLGDHPHFDAADQARFGPALTPNARRRQVLGGLVVAMGATLLLGLLPTFRLLLVVHLFLVNSCLAYVGLLVHVRDQRTGRSRAGAAARVRPLAVGAPTAADAEGYGDAYVSPGFEYDDDTHEEPAYAGAEYAEYGYDGYGYEGEADDEAEAAYVDELGLALPA